jgi:hypothetical protein
MDALIDWATFGWPLVAAAIGAFGVAFATRHKWAGLVGALISVPLCLYLADMPYGLRWVSLAASGANFLSAAAVWRQRNDIGFAMLLPFMLMVVLTVILWQRNFNVFRGFVF